METIPYKEEIFTTPSLWLAATLIVFGAKLRQQLPLEWSDIYPSKDAFIENSENPRAGRPKNQISFNFEPQSVNKDIVRAYSDQHAAEDFGPVLDKEGLNPEQKKIVLAAHSRALAHACREALEARDYLAKLIKSIPESAKWNVVQGENGSLPVIFGKRCSPERQAEMLSKL